MADSKQKADLGEELYTLEALLQADGEGIDDAELIKQIEALLGTPYAELLNLKARLEGLEGRAELMAEVMPQAMRKASAPKEAIKTLEEATLPLAKRLQYRLEKPRRRRIHLLWLPGCRLKQR